MTKKRKWLLAAAGTLGALVVIGAIAGATGRGSPPSNPKQSSKHKRNNSGSKKLNVRRIRNAQSRGKIGLRPLRGLAPIT